MCSQYIFHQYIAYGMTNVLDMNEALVPPTQPNVAHVLNISEALALPTHPNVAYFPI